MDRLWLEAPAAALRVWDEAGVQRHRPNPAALDWQARTDGLPGDCWQVAAAALAPALAGGTAQGLLALGTTPLRWNAVPCEPGWLVWLKPALPIEEAHRLAHRFGRFGVFERDLRTDQAVWDPFVFELFGLPPAAQAPSFFDATRQIHPDDRERMRAQHLRAVAAPSRHEIRYRLVRPDGSVRVLQALVESLDPVDGRPTRLLGVILDDTDTSERVQAQQALSEQLARALDLAGVSVWRIALATQRIDTSPAGLRLLDLPADMASTALANTRALVHPDDVARVAQAADAAAAGTGTVDVTARFRHADGRWRHLLTRRIAERDARGRVVALVGISLDQTAQVEANERALALARRIALVTEAAGIGLWSLDLDSGALEWNAQMRRIYGLDATAPVPGFDAWLRRLVHPDDRAAFGQRWRAAAQAGAASFDLDFRIVRPDGALRWVVARGLREQRDGRPYLFGIHVDVTELRAAEAELRRQQQRLEAATQAAGVGVWERGADGLVTYWDAQMYRLRGLGPADPRPIREITDAVSDPALHERTAALARNTLATGEPYHHEFRVVWPDGSEHWLATTGAVRRDAEGRVVGTVGVNVDVTPHRRAEAALRERDAAERASRLKSEFLARMSHELRTPLNAVLGFAQLVEHDAAALLPPLQRDRLARIRSAGQHLLGLIDDVLDLSAVEAGALPLAREPVSLDALLDEVAGWIAPLAERQGVAVEAAATGAWVLGDPRRVRQVLANLLTNAVKYNRAGGRVWWSVHRTDAGRWSLAVHDDGPGLSAAQRARLFEPFNRLGAERSGVDGVGLGLVVVRRLVEAMGGAVDVADTPRAGMSIRIELPAAPPAAAAPAAAVPAVVAVAPRSAVRAALLYIEDNPVNVLLVEELVRLRPGLRFASAPDGASGVAAALAAPPQLVLVDMHLPDIDGLEVLRRLRAAPATRGCRIVALSANAMPEELARARAAGFDDYWTKPIDFGRFLAGLDELLPA
jgi:PAS domain S-box-containing protein